MVNNKSVRDNKDPFELMHDVMHQLRSMQLRAFQGAGHEIAPMEAKTLGFYARHPGATQSDLVAHTGRDKGQLARLITGLKDKGLLLSEADANDGRITRLYLSDDAKAMHLQVQRQRQQLSERALEGINTEQLQLLTTLLQTMHSNLHRQP